MNSGMIKIEWSNINNYSEEEITYYLFLEGKSVETISKIRNLQKEVIQNQIINCKIKYRFLAKSKDPYELIQNIAKTPKQDKVTFLNYLKEEDKQLILEYIKTNYIELHAKEKEIAIWIIGELKDESCLDILCKACVHKFINVRRMAVSAMGKIGSIKAENALIRTLEDENSQVVAYAIKALIKIKSEKAKSRIELIDCRNYSQAVLNAKEEYLKQVGDD